MGKNSSKWSEEEDRTLRSLYSDHTIEQIMPFLSGRTSSAILARAYVLKLKKDPVWKRQRSEIGMFKKGHVPVNKGKTWDEMMSPEGQNRSRQTWFKKGLTPHNKVPIGHERRTRGGYILVKVAEPNVFKQKHRILWEQHHGPIPKGFDICFIDGNPDNLTIENLRAETQRDKFLRCGCLHNILPSEIRYICHLKGALKRQLNKHQKPKEE